MTQNKIKVLFWTIGVVFSIIFYYLSRTHKSLLYLSEISFLPFLIILIILFLFFLIGVLFSKIPIFWYSKFKKSNLKEVLNEVKLKEKEEEINSLVLKLKNAISFLIKTNYSEESINYLITNVGLSRELADNIVINIKKLKRIRTFSVLLGLFLSVALYFVIINIPIFSSIPKFIFVLSALIIFLLFVLEGYLVTRMPDSFYLSLVNINREHVIKIKREVLEKEEAINSYKDKQKALFGNIEKATKFLLEQNVDKNEIIDFFSKFDIDKNVILKFIENFEKEISLKNKFSSEKGDVLFEKKSDAAIKLTLSKIQESFKQINEIYNEVSKLQKEVQDISERQKKLENLSTINVSKEVKKLKKDPIINSKIKGIEDIKKVDPEKIKELLAKKNLEYEKLISYLYHLFLPHVETSSQNDIFSTLVYHGYPYEVVEDVLQKFKDKKIVFGKDKNRNLTDKIVDKINKIYDIFSK